MERTGIRHFKTHCVVHARLAGIVLGDGDSLRIHIAAPDVVCAVKLLVHGLLCRIQPRLGREETPFLRVKAAVKTGGAVFGDQRRLNGDRTAAAERIAEGVAAAVTAQKHHGGCQRFAQRRFHADGAVAALIQSLAAGIQTNGGGILEKGKANLVFYPRFGELLHMVVGLEPLDDGFFDNRLTGGHGMKLRGNGVTLHGESRVTGQIILPRNGPGALKQLLKAAGGKLAQHQHDPRAAAQIEIQTGAVRRCAAAQDAAVFHAHLLQPQLFDLIAHQFFQAQQAGNQICCHRIPHFVYIQFCSVYRAERKSARQKFTVAHSRIFGYNDSNRGKRTM